MGQVGVSPILLTLSRILSCVYPSFSLDTKLDATTISCALAVVRACQQDPLVHSLGTPRLSTEMSSAQEWTLAHVADLRLPLLVILSGADRLVPPEAGRQFYAAVTFADKELHEYEGAYHETHNDIIASQVMGDTERWLEKHLP